MAARFTPLLSILIGLSLTLTLIAGPFQPQPAPAAAPPADYQARVEQAAQTSWSQRAAPRPGHAEVVLVQLDQPPLAIVGRAWDQGQRSAYQATLRAEQDRLTRAIQTIGGHVQARLHQLSSGLVVTIDGGRIPALSAIPGVAAILPVNNYAVAQTDPGAATTLQQVAELIGSAEVRRRGNDGSGVDIAIVDSGLDYTHRKLGGSGSLDAYYRAYCGGALLRPGDPACDPTLDPPIDLFPNAKVRGGYDYIGDRWPNPDPSCPEEDADQICVNPDPNPIDGVGHGTHVADIAAGLPISADGSDAGIAPGASLWAYKACNGELGLCDGTAILLAIDNAMDLDGSDRGRCRVDLGQTCSAYDPADIITIAVSYRYGHPEDALTLFADIASYYGSLVVTSAGNDGNIPYVIGTPAAAAATLAVAESQLPAAPAPQIRVDGQEIDARLQPWSPAITAPQASALRYGDGTDTTGCDAIEPWDGALLLDRGGCPVPVKVRNAAEAGASLLLIADTTNGATPPALASADSDLPVLSLTRSDAETLRATLAESPVTVEAAPGGGNTGEQIAPSSSRGPRIADGAVKPDLAAPGAILSAAAGTGDQLSAFGGSSGSAPVVAGAAALLVQELERRGLIDGSTGLRDPSLGELSLGPFLKALLTNTAAQSVTAPDGLPAPVTLTGAGRVNALGAFTARSLALDATEMVRLLEATPTPPGCPVRPYRDLINYLFFGRTPACAIDYPFGNALMRAWNAQSGGISFGYRPTVGYQEIQRQVALVNFSRSDRTYQVSSQFRDPADSGLDVELRIEPSELLVGANSIELITLTLTLGPRSLPSWELNAGALGDRGSCPAGSAADCPSLDRYEIDGTLRISDGASANLTLPWQVLPRRVADVSVVRVEPDQIILRNLSEFQEGLSEAFALVDVSPNQCDRRNGICTDVDYTPGVNPGSAQSPVDLNQVGVRGRSVPGLNAEYGLPPAPAGAAPDELIEFAVTVYDRPYRATPLSPARFEITVDADRDGRDDYLVYNAEAARDGRSAVFVRDLNPADGTQAERFYRYSDVNFNTQAWILPVPAAAIGLRSDQPFRFVVRAFDSAFGGAAWDCSPAPTATCGDAAHTFQTGQPRFITESSFSVPTLGRYALTYAEDPAAADSSQIGALLIFRQAQSGQESVSVRLR